MTTNPRVLHGILDAAPMPAQECIMPRGKKIGTINVRIDKEFAQAVETLQDIYPDVSKSELIREAVIEKAKRDAQQRTKRPDPKP